MSGPAKPRAYELAGQVGATLIPHHGDRKWLVSVDVAREGAEAVTMYREPLPGEHVGPPTYETANQLWGRVAKMLRGWR